MIFALLAIAALAGGILAALIALIIWGILADGKDMEGY